MASIGYIRVSSTGQNLERQLVGVTLDKTFEEKASAKDTAGRPQLHACIDYAREGDTVHVHSIDRMARTLGELLGLIEQLNTKGVVVQFHKEGLMFTGADNAMQRLQMQIMGAVAEFERSLIRERQREGIAAAKAAGKRFGRSRALSDDQVSSIRARIAAGESKTAVAQSLGVSRQTLYSALDQCPA